MRAEKRRFFAETPSKNSGYPMFAGLGVLLILTPVNLISGKMAETYLDDQLKVRVLRIANY